MLFMEYHPHCSVFKMPDLERSQNLFHCAIFPQCFSSQKIPPRIKLQSSEVNIFFAPLGIVSVFQRINTSCFNYPRLLRMTSFTLRVIFCCMIDFVCEPIPLDKAQKTVCLTVINSDFLSKNGARCEGVKVPQWLLTTVSSASVAVGCRRLPLEEHPHPGGEREPVRAARHQQEGVQEDTGGGKST